MSSLETNLKGHEFAIDLWEYALPRFSTKTRSKMECGGILAVVAPNPYLFWVGSNGTRSMLPIQVSNSFANTQIKC